MAKKPGSDFIEQQKAAEALKQTTTDEVTARLLEMQFQQENRKVQEEEAATARFLKEDAEAQRLREIRQKREAEEADSLRFIEQMQREEAAEAQRQKEIRQKREAEDFINLKKEQDEAARRLEELRQKRAAEEAEEIAALARRFEAQERAERQREEEASRKLIEAERAKEAQAKREDVELAKRIEAAAKAEVIERAERQRKEEESFKRFMDEETAIEDRVKAEKQRQEKEAEEILFLEQSKVYTDAFILKEMNTLAEVRTEKFLKYMAASERASSGSSSSSSSSPSKSSGVKISPDGQEVFNLIQGSSDGLTKGLLVGMGYSIDAVDEAYKMLLGENNLVALTDLE